MKSLLIRFFVSFWLIIGITVGAAALGGYWYADHLRNIYDNYELGDALIEASAALDSAGRDGLTVWLENLPKTAGMSVVVLDRQGRDLLGRSIPRHLRRLYDRQRRAGAKPHERGDPANLLRARPLSQLIGPDGQRYTFVLVPSRDGLLMNHGLPNRGFLLLLAVILSAAASLFLARAFSRPVRQLRQATRSLADGNFSSRVASSVGKRSDELGLLARDFDLMADNVERSIGQQAELSRNVSHELRSPLARLRVALELARGKAGELAEFERIDRETERIDALIGNILSYTRLDSIRNQGRATVDLQEVLADVVDDVNFEYRSSGSDQPPIELAADQSAVLLVHADSVRSAIENIVRNAARHTQPGTEVRVALQKDDDGTVRISVADRGNGVAQDDLEKIFEPFYRSKKSATNGGSGLGLAIAKRAMELNGGRVTAYNNPHGGLTIDITLPATDH